MGIEDLNEFIRLRGLETDLASFQEQRRLATHTAVQEENARRLEEIYSRGKLENYGKRFKNPILAYVASRQGRGSLASVTSGGLGDADYSKKRFRTSFLASTAMHSLALILLGFLSVYPIRHSKVLEKQYDVKYVSVAKQTEGLEKLTQDSQDKKDSLRNTGGSNIISYPLGFNPRVQLGETKQSTSTNQVVDYLSTYLNTKILPDDIHSKLEELILSGGDPKKLYNHTFDKGDSNTISYVDFHKAYIDAYLRVKDRPDNKLFVCLYENIHLAHISYLLIAFKEDGTLAFLPMLNPIINDPDMRIIRHYERLFNNMPKKFIPPSQANLRAPFSILLGVRNLLLPYQPKIPTDLFIPSGKGFEIYPTAMKPSGK